MENKKSWISDARKFMTASLSPMPHELNEIDWKTALTDNNEKMAKHISAFANHQGGGFFVFGISTDGKIQGLTDQSETEEIIKKLGNIARAVLEPPQKI